MHITQRPELGQYMTFEFSKEKPIHGWFWYKEGFAPELVQFALSEMPNATTLLDPFCGVGTTLLAAKAAGKQSIGVDASSLAAFISRTKTDDYSKQDLEDAFAFLSVKLPSYVQADWQFELFNPRAAFPKRNYNEILSIRAAIDSVENEKARHLLLLALLSSLPQSSIIMKDGGVLKIDKNKRALPAREIFKRKVKRMVRELEPLVGTTQPVPQVFLGDARALDIATGSIDLVVTSPPYLNNIDYSKIYGLELSLLHMSKAEASQVRMRAIRSFIGKQMDVSIDAMPPEVGDIGHTIPIIGTYFKDMELAIREMHRVLRSGGIAHVNVSNSVIHETHVMVDEVFAQIAERIGFSETEIIVGAERIADVKPQEIRTRESIVVMRK